MRGTLPEFPWDRLEPYAELAAMHADGMLNLSIGSPVDSTPDAVREALKCATDAHAYPQAAGTPALREAIAHWFQRRRGVTLTADAVLPTVGSKELVAMLPFYLGLGAEDAVVIPRVAYPSYAMSAALVGADVVTSDDPAEWPQHTKLIWLNSPGNPDGRVLSAETMRQAVATARELGAVIAGDECYAEFGWDAPWDSQPIPSILDPQVVGTDHSNVLSVYSLSKQSNLAGYRAAFLGGDPEVVAQLREVRKHAGLLVPGPIQEAMIVALGDAAHVDDQRERYRARRETLRTAVEAAGFTVEGSEAGIYLWVTRGENAWQTTEAFAKLGILVAPGVFYGEDSAQHVRMALTASDEDIARAAERLSHA